MTCGQCGVTFAMPEEMRDDKERNGGEWYCVNGHGRIYKKTVREKLREAQEALARERARRDQAEASATAQRAAATRARNERDRLKKRAAAGVCPCCNRTFQQLARHMKSKHPDFPKVTDAV
jgi:chromosome segregation ATPase